MILNVESFNRSYSMGEKNDRMLFRQIFGKGIGIELNASYLLGRKTVHYNQERV
jgi:hypothetical protein